MQSEIYTACYDELRYLDPQTRTYICNYNYDTIIIIYQLQCYNVSTLIGTTKYIWQHESAQAQRVELSITSSGVLGFYLLFQTGGSAAVINFACVLQFLPGLGLL